MNNILSFLDIIIPMSSGGELEKYLQERERAIHEWQAEDEIPVFLLRIDDTPTRRDAARKLVERTALTITKRLPLQQPSGVLSLMIDLPGGPMNEAVFWEFARQALIQTTENGGVLQRNWRGLKTKDIPPTLYGNEELDNPQKPYRTPCNTLRQLAKKAGLERIELVIPQLELMAPQSAAVLLGRFWGDRNDNEWLPEKGPPCLIKAAAPSNHPMPYLGTNPGQVYLRSGQAKYYNLPPPKLR